MLEYVHEYSKWKNIMIFASTAQQIMRQSIRQGPLEQFQLKQATSQMDYNIQRIDHGYTTSQMSFTNTIATHISPQ